MKRCPRCGTGVHRGEQRRFVDSEPYGEIKVPRVSYFGFEWECPECGWEGDKPLLAYTEDYGTTPFNEGLEEVLNFLAVGTKEALVNAHRELGRLLND